MSQLLTNRQLVCRLVILACLGFCWIGSGRMYGQGATATILGTITDASGAVISAATVQLKNIDTGATQSTMVDAQGRYRIAQLSIGNYEAQATSAGFSTVLQKGITLTVGAQSVVDFTLQVGQQQQTISVEAAVAQVETTNATIGTYTSQQQMSDLPLNGRNFEQLIQLAPGVAPVTWSTNSLQGRALQYSVAGGRPTGQAILLDDENLQNFWNNGMGSVTGSSLGVEAISEFQTLTNAYGAQFGGSGAVVNAASKSGTNSYHGSAFDYLRNSVFDSRDFFYTGAKRPAFRRNQFGASLGGAIKKDKLFFFADYEGVRQLFQATKTATVPACNLPNVCTPAANVSAATAKAITDTLAIYPRPSVVTSATTGLWFNSANQISTEDYGLGRLDYTISEKDTIFLRTYADNAVFKEPYGGANITGGGPLPFWPATDQSFSLFSTLEERHIFSPTVVNVSRLSFSRPTKNSNQSSLVNVNGANPLQQFFPSATGLIDALINITGLSSIGGGAIEKYDLVQNRYTVADDVLWTRGAHSIRFGASISRSQANTSNSLKENAIWAFNGLSAFLAGTARQVEAVIPSPTNDPRRDYRQTDIAPYVNDEWKVSSRLTMNLGVRYSFVTNPTEARNRLFAIPNMFTSTGYANVPTVFGSNPSIYNIDPRVGIAYDPFSDHKTSIRAGFGMFHDPISGQAYQVGFQAAPPWNLSQQQNPIYPFAFSTLSTVLPSATSGWNRTDGVTTPYMIQYNLSVQRELMQGTVLTMAYVGSRGVHLLTGMEDNPPIPTIDANGVYRFATLSGTTPVTNPRRNPAFGPYVNNKPISSSRYNSLQVMLNRRFSQNVQAQVNYTWSRCIDNGAFGVGSFNGQSQTPAAVMNPYNQAPDKGVCSYDLTHILRVNGSYAFPFFKNNLILGGWQISGIVSGYSGTPFNVASGADQMGTNGTPSRPNYASGCDPYAGARTIDKWFNPACYVQQPYGTAGNTGRNTLRGPNFFNADVSLLKDTKVTEQVKAQFRFEVFNIFNHANFATPANTIFTAVNAATYNANAGRITSTNQGASPRQMQFALKFIF